MPPELNDTGGLSMIRSIFPMVWLAMSAFGATFSLMLSAWFLDVSWLIAAVCCLMTLAVQLKSEQYQIFRFSLDTRATLIASLVFAAVIIAADQSAFATALVLLQLISWLLYEFWYSPIKQPSKTRYNFEQKLPSITFRHMDAPAN